MLQNQTLYRTSDQYQSERSPASTFSEKTLKCFMPIRFLYQHIAHKTMFLKQIESSAPDKKG